MNEEAYLAGLICADGSIDAKEKSISIYSNDVCFSSRVAELLARVSKRNAKVYNSKGAFKVYSYAPEFATRLNEKYEIPFGRKSDIIRFPHSLSKRAKKSFLQGFADGDGSVFVEKRKRYGLIYRYLRVELASQSKEFLLGVKEFLQTLKISSGSVKRGCRVFRIRIYASNAEHFVDKVGFSHPQKISSFLKPQAVDKSLIPWKANSQTLFSSHSIVKN